MGRLGGLVHLSAMIERELSRAIQALSGEAPAAGLTAGPKAQLWRSLQAGVCAARPDHAALLAEVDARIARARELRNMLVHGLNGAVADPGGHTGGAGYHVDLPGHPDFVPFADLEGLLPVMRHLTQIIPILTAAAREGDEARARNSYAGIRLNLLRPLPDLGGVMG